MVLGLVATVQLGADTLPIWACYDCLVMITHLPLINVQIPGKSSVLLTEIAKILRFQFETVQDWTNEMDVGETNRPLTNILAQNGYDSTSIITNLSTILGMFIVLLLLLVFAKCIDCSYVTNLK